MRRLVLVACAFACTAACVTPLATAATLFGSQQLGPHVADRPAGVATAYRTVPTTTGSVARLSIYVEAKSQAQTLVAGLYRDSNGQPGALLSQATLTSLTVGAWNTVTIPAVSVTKGTPYWIALMAPAGDKHLHYYDRCCGGGASQLAGSTSLTTLPSTWTAGGAVGTDGQLSAYGWEGPILSVSPTSLMFSGAYGGAAPAAQLLTVTNTGDGALTWTASDNATWLSLSPTSGSGNGSVTASVTTTGLAVGTYNATITVSATNAQRSPQQIPVTLTVADRTSPSVSVTSPAAGALLVGRVSVAASASDNVGVVGVQFFLDGATLGVEDTAAPYSVSWDTASAVDGSHTLTAVARDAAGNRTTSAAVRVTVDNTSPSVTLANPGAAVRGTISLSASASDAGSGVASVAFDRAPAGSGVWTRVGSATASPFAVSLDTSRLADGLYDFRAVATDVAGNAATSVVGGVQVDNAAPSVSLSAPVAGAGVRGTVSVSASAADNVGVVGVQFLLDGAPFGAEVTVAPFRSSWDSSLVTNGSHTLAAVARDAAGNRTTSASVTVTVDNSVQPPPAASVLLGSASSAGSVDALAAGSAEAFAASASLSGSVSTLSVFVDASSSGSLDLGLYGDASGHPGARLAEGFIGAPLLGAWNTVSFAPVSVKAGSRYWIALLAVGAPVRFHDRQGSATASETAAGAGLVGLPGSWTSGSSGSAGGLAGYASGSGAGLSVTPSALSFSASQAAPTPAAQTITIANTGGGTLSWQVVSDSQWLSATPLLGSDGGVVVVSANAAGLSPGGYSGKLTVTAAGANGSPATVNVTLTVDDSQPPSVAVTSPAAGALLVGRVSVGASASDDTGVVGVQFSLDGASLGAESTAAPYSVSWDTASAVDGVHTLTAVARDAAGNVTTSDPVRITVDNTPPSVALRSPGGAISRSVDLSASASDATSGVASVAFEWAPAGSGSWTRVGNVSAAPFSVSLDTTRLADGTYDLRAVATDGAGNLASSVVTGVQVDNAAPSVSVSAPPAGAGVRGSVTLAASAADNVGVVGVRFLLDGAPSGAEVTAAPFTLSWDSSAVANGSHTVTAVARDAAGNRTTSSAVSVTVDNSAQPAPSGTLLLGTSSSAGSVDELAAGSAKAFVASASANGSLSTLSVFVDATSAGSLDLGLYADAGGHPGVRLAERLIGAPFAGAWNTISFTPVSVGAGARYWIALLALGAPVRFHDRVGAATASESAAGSTLTGLPSAWTSGTSGSAGGLAAYASGSAAGLSVTPLNLNFSASQAAPTPASQTVAIANTGGGTLSWQLVSDSAWLTATPMLGSDGGLVVVSANATGLAPGNYNGNLTVTALGASGSPATVNVTLAVAGTDPISSTNPPDAPAGLTGMALDSTAELAWQPVAGAVSYNVYRGTSASAISTLVTPIGVAGTTFDDTAAQNGGTYYYAVRAVNAGGESASSATVQVTPQPRACSTGNAVVLENCYPGNTPWTVRNAAKVSAGGIEGFATQTSVNKGQSVDLKINSSDQTTLRIEVYRTGYYGGAEARLFSVVRGVRGTLQPACVSDAATGLLDCSNWSTSYTLTTTANWPSGAYVLRLVRDDDGTDNQILLVVRDDSRPSALLYGVALSNYQSYNNYGGKSLYDFNSIGNATVAGTARAVKVSYDRPFEQPRSGQRDWYTRNEMGMVSWLEQSGYDVAYVSNTDLETKGALLLSHKAYVSAAHDEYWSAGMRSAAQQARDKGVSLFFSGSNEVYWKIRFENSPLTGAAGRVQVCYKTTQQNPDGSHAPADPSGVPTGTWRDPNGANQPENALTGEMYVGDNDNKYFPLVVPAADGTDRVFRYTPLATQAPGTSTSIGSSLVGWEWDARVANGQEPVGVKTLTESPVTGDLIQAFGGYQTSGTATVSAVKYTAPSGALVLTTGTNHWARGLGLNAAGVGEPNQLIQQVTTNLLEDMGVAPATSAANITLDNPNTQRPAAPTGLTATGMGSDHVMLSWNPVAGAQGYNVYRSTAPRQDGQPLGQLANSALLTTTSFADMGLPPSTTFYYVVTAVVNGVQSLGSSEATATTLTAVGQPTLIDAGGPAYMSSTGQMYVADNYFSGGQTHSTTAPISGTNDPALYQTERFGAMTYTIPGLADQMYDVYLHFAELYYGSTVPGSCVGKRIFSVNVNNAPTPQIQNLDICAQVGPDAALTASVSNVMVQGGQLTIQFVRGAADDPEVTAIDVVPMHMAGNPIVTDTSPADGSTNASRLTQPRATFSEPMDASTIDASSFTVTDSAGRPVAGTVGYDGATNSARFVPSAPLAYGATYTARLTTDVMSMDEMPLMDPVTWTFTTAQAVPPTIVDAFPEDASTGMSVDSMIHVEFSKDMDPATIDDMSFTLTDDAGMQVMGMVTYDPTMRTAMFMPDMPLDYSTAYEVHLDTSIESEDGVPLATASGFGFTTAPGPLAPPTVVAQTPAPDATSVARTTTVTATFSEGMHGDPAVMNTQTFTLTGPNGIVGATVAYDPATFTATLTPTQPLGAGTYTARLESMMHALDGEPLAAPVTWSFTTVPPPSVTSTSPAAGSGYASLGGTVTATFSHAMAASTLTSSSFTLKAASGSPVQATVSYDATSRTATLAPAALLGGGTTYTATLAATVADADGVALGAPYSWSFTTAACPCQLFSALTQPSVLATSTQDGRTGTGPWTYELGVKAQADEPMLLTAIRFYKSPGETGVHVGNVWSAAGVNLASVTFANETASGWQQQALVTPLPLSASTTYVVSVNANKYFATTKSGLAAQVASGPLHTVADGKNGVYGSAAGVFPTSSFSSTNYFVDFQAVPSGTPAPPSVTASTPAANATAVSRSTTVTATFSRAMDASSLGSSTFTLAAPNGALVPATVSYSSSTLTATLTPNVSLSYSTTYTAFVSGSVRATDGMPMGTPVQWSFAVAAPTPPTVTSVAPAAGSSTVAGSAALASVMAQLSKSIDPFTLTSSTFTLTGPNGAVPATVSYTDSTLTATLTPNAPLAVGTYTAQLDSSVAATDGSALGTPYSWTFSVVPSQPPLAVVSSAPAAGVTGVARDSSVLVTFNRAVDPASVTTTTFQLTAPDGSAVARTVSLDAAGTTATMKPTSLLAPSTTYTVVVTTGVRGAADATPLAAPWSSTFTTDVCPCQLFLPTLTPGGTYSVQDSRTGTGPWSYEMGVKFTVDRPAVLVGIRFYKGSSLEPAPHTGTLWSASGQQLATVTFGTETATGWQQANFATPVALQPNTVYVASVGLYKYYVATKQGLLTQIDVGPLHSVADGKNGVYASAAGLFPNQTYTSNNYFVDVVVK